MKRTFCDSCNKEIGATNDIVDWKPTFYFYLANGRPFNMKIERIDLSFDNSYIIDLCRDCLADIIKEGIKA